MGHQLRTEESHGVGIELRKESFYITEPDDEKGEHIFSYGDEDEPVIEITYELFNRLLRIYEEDEKFKNKIRSSV
jgi:hypothetical protein